MKRLAINLRGLIRDTTYDLTHERAKKSRIRGVKKSDFEKARFTFLVKAWEDYSDPKGHLVSLHYPEVELENFVGDRRRTPLASDVVVWCTCPAFHYWGSEYWANQMKYSLIPGSEDRFPRVRDPKKERLVCKHLIKVSKYVSKKGFAYLIKRFETKRSTLEEPIIRNLDEIKPTVFQYLISTGEYSPTIAQRIIDSLDMSNWETVLSEHGVII